MAVKYHPDKNIGDDDYFKNKFIEIKEAYEAIGNPENRESYNEKLKAYRGKLNEAKAKTTFEKNRSKQEEQRKYEESFSYSAHKPFFSSSDRDNSITPEQPPAYDFFGEIIDEGLEFLIFPKKIGKLVMGYSNLRKTDNPTTKIKKVFNLVLYPLIGFGIAYGIFYFFSPLIFWTIVWFVVFGGGSILVALGENSFEYEHFFIGINGFSKATISGSRSNAQFEYEINFHEITDVFVAQTEYRQNFSYQGTDYYYLFVDSNRSKTVLTVEGSFDKKDSKTSQPTELHYLRSVEQFWTIYLLDKMEEQLERDGCLRFNLYDEERGVVPYIELGLGYISFLKTEKQTYKFNEIKRMYTKGTDLHIEHINFNKGFLGLGKSGNVDSIPLLQISNRQFLEKAIELLLGFK